MPNKTIYVRDEDLQLYDKVAADESKSISARFADFLRFEESLWQPQKIQYSSPTPTLRDHFAMAALNAMISTHPWPNPHHKGVYEEATKWAYEWADVMLEARK